MSTQEASHATKTLGPDGVYADRTACCDRDHCHIAGTRAAGRAENARVGEPDRMHEQPKANWACMPRLPRRSQGAAASPNPWAGHATWLVLIMPYIEQRGVYELWDLTRTYYRQ